MMIPNKVTALITVFLTFILFIIIQPGDNPVALIKVASIVAGIMIVVIIAYTHFLWRLEPFKKMHKIVDINGKWAGVMPIGDKTIEVEVRIKQHFDDVSVKLITNHNVSDSLVTKIVEDHDGWKLYIVYKCKPIDGVSSKDDIDYGTIMVRLDEDILEGEFYNSKKLSGKIELYRK